MKEQLQLITGAVSKRGRPLSKPLRSRHAEAATAGASAGPGRGRPPLSRQASRIQSDSTVRHDSYNHDADPSTTAPLSPLHDDPDLPFGGFEPRHEAPVDILAAAAATLAGCKKDKQGMLPIWGHKGRRSQGHDVSPVKEDAEVDAPERAERAGLGDTAVRMQQSEGTGRSLRPRALKKQRST